MSNITVEISPRGTFSYHWNKGADNNDIYCTRLGKSVIEFLKACFFGHKVFKITVEDQSFISEDGEHKDSIFVKEYRKKLKNMQVKQVNEKVYELVKGKAASNKPEGEKLLENNKNDLVEVGEGARIKTLFDEAKELITNKNFEEFIRFFTIEKIDLLGKEDCCKLFQAAYSLGKGEIACALLLTEKCDDSVHLLESHKENMLSFFARRGILMGLKYLLEKKIIDIDGTLGNGNTPMINAVRAHSDECVNALLKAGADVNKAGSNGVTPLHMAVTHGSQESFNMLINAGADVNKANNLGMTAIAFSVIWGKKECLDVLLKHNDININMKNNNGDTVLHTLEECFLYDLPLFEKTNKQQCLGRLLSEPKININALNSRGLTPLQCAKKASNEKYVDMLRTYGVGAE